MVFTLKVRVYSLVIIIVWIREASLTLGKTIPIVRGICLTFSCFMKHKNQLIYPKIRVHSLLILDGSIGIILDHRIRGVFAPEMLLLFASIHWNKIWFDFSNFSLHFLHLRIFSHYFFLYYLIFNFKMFFFNSRKFVTDFSRFSVILSFRWIL